MGFKCGVSLCDEASLSVEDGEYANSVLKGFLAAFFLSIVLAVSCFVVSGLAPARTAMASTTQTVTIQGALHQTEAHKMLSLVNGFRTNTVTSAHKGSEPWYWNESNTKRVECKNLGKLEWDYSLEKIAIQRAEEIAAVFSHTRSNGKLCFTAKDGNVQSCGENIASGMGWYEDAQTVFVGWREDDDSYSGQGHRRNMLTSGFTAFASACFEVDGVYFWVQEFGYSKSNTPSFSRYDSKVDARVDVDSNYEELSYKLKSDSSSVSVGKEFVLPEKLKGVFEPWNGVEVPFSVEPSSWRIASGSDCISSPDGSRYEATAAGAAVFETSALGKTATYTVRVSRPSAPSKPEDPKPSVTPFKPVVAKVAAPKGTSLTKTSKAKKAFSVKWKKVSGIKGYQIRWSTKSSMAGAKASTVKSAKTTTKKVSKLKKKTKYYVQVRTYKVVKGKTYWSGWSKTKSVKIK